MGLFSFLSPSSSSSSSNVSTTTSTPTSQTGTASQSGVVFQFAPSAATSGTFNVSGLDDNEKALFMGLLEDNYQLGQSLVSTSQGVTNAIQKQVEAANSIQTTAAGVSSLDQNLKPALIIGGIVAAIFFITKGK